MTTPAELITIDKQVCFSLYSASNAIIRAYRPVLDELDLTYLQYMAMLVLWEESPLNVKEIGQKLKLDSGTLTPLLRRLEQKGLVLRTRSTQDERVRQISLTEQGIELKNRALAIPEKIACKVGITIDQFIELKGLCDLVVSKLAD